MPAEQPLLRTKLLRWLLLPLGLLLTADTAVSYWFALRSSERAHDRALLEIARDTSIHLRSDDGRVRFDMPEPARAVIFTDVADKLYYEITTPSGELIDGTRFASPRRGSGANAAELLYEGEIEGEPVRVAELWVFRRGDPRTPQAIVRIAETKVKRRELTGEIVLSVVLPQVLLILFACVIVWVGVVKGLSPLASLQQAIAARSYRDRSPVRVSQVPGEVRPLMDAINQLLERLDNALTMQDRFTADAAHQLKTPVAALQAQLELALNEPDGQPTRESLTKIQVGLERLSHLVSQLLALARNEPEAARTMTVGPVDLAALAFDATADWVNEALRKEIDLGYEGEKAGVTVQGDPVRLRELLDNLLDNALRYTPQRGRVTVRVVDGGAPALSVSDDGPTIPAADRQRIFQRFYRVLGTAERGSGLGLAIAQEIAHLHGATITPSDDLDGRGNTFTLSFPPASQR
ncbi:MAG TPA: sensor histidine kinase N-terminal domain-containing protein [Burkholderiales bacterium]|nr:sensor histidine kinase N-terminal domain-containing protein [Burkholderiales bacterium]